MDTIHTRRSIRRYTTQPIAPELIDQLLDAAIRAPSAHNRQPWRFAVVTTPEVKTKLADAMGHRLRADRLEERNRVSARNPVSIEAIDRDVARSHDRIVAAPVVIIACLSMTDMDHYPDDRRASFERTMAIQSVAASIENMLLTATALGLGACWMCAPLFCPDVVRAALDLPNDWEAQALITIGYPKGADEGKPKDRVDYQNITLRR